MDAVPEERVESARNDETSAPVGDTSLGELARILDHTSYQDDDDQQSNEFIEFDNKDGMKSVGSFEYISSKVNKGRRKPKGCGVSNVLGYKLNTPFPNHKATKAVGQKSKFVLEEDIIDSYITDVDITLKNEEHYGMPRSSDYENK